MKYLIVLTLFIFSFSAQGSLSKARKHYQNGADARKVIKELMKSKYYFSAAIFAKKYITENKDLPTEFDETLKKLVLKTGTMTFLNLNQKVLNKSQLPTLRFISAIKYFHHNKNKQVVKKLKTYPMDHHFAPEAMYIYASALNLVGAHKSATKAYKSCLKTSDHFANKSDNKKIERYYDIIKESCTIHQARMSYKERNYEKAISTYEKIHKTSYRWPYLILEKAWSSYYQEDYNRTLGLLVTYKSPLLNSYFMPEAEVLTALSYLKLCLWDDALEIVNHYYKVYRPRSVELKKVLVAQKSSHTYFLKMMLSPISQQEELNPYIRVLMTQIRKKVKFSLDLVNYKKAQNELKYIKKMRKSKFKTLLYTNVKRSLSWRTKHLNHYIKKQMFSFINDIYRYSYEMFNIKLEISSLKRDLVYKNQKLIANRSRGTQDNVKRRSDQHFYQFAGEFWGDELGEYSFGLKSNCQFVANKGGKK